MEFRHTQMDDHNSDDEDLFSNSGSKSKDPSILVRLMNTGAIINVLSYLSAAEVANTAYTYLTG